MKPWILLDVSYLCHRAYYTTGHLSYGDVSTGVLYGFFQTMVDLADRFLSTRFVFCFDQKPYKRNQLYAEYKGDRKPPKTEAERDGLGKMHQQIAMLRDDYLGEIGYRNVFCKEGFEADDLMASAVLSLSKPDRGKVLMVTADKDIYQMLAPNVAVWNPHRQTLLTYKGFRRMYGVEPSAWPIVQALVGGHDNIRGVKGIGEKTALKFVQNMDKGPAMLNVGVYRNIDPMHVEDNLALIRLPFPGTPTYKPRDDEVDPHAWRRVMKELGIGTLKSPPV